MLGAVGMILCKAAPVDDTVYTDIGSSLQSTHLERQEDNVGDLGSFPGLGRSLGEGKGYPLQYSGLENSMDCIIHGVTKSRTRLSDFHLHFFLQGTME